jgi:ABC-type ATPase with predicted acetyltransferase domain
MNKSISDNQKKRGRPATGIRAMVGFRAGDELTAALDNAAAEQDAPSRSELIRRIVVEWLKDRGYLRNAQSDQGLRPDQLNSENDG